MPDYLVTGGCGFIGSHLCEALLARGAGVRILDDLSTGSADNAPAGSVLLRGSVSDPQIVEQALRNVAGCFHLAAVSSVERSTDDWLGSHRTNLSGAVAVFNAARRLTQGRPIPVVYASSAAVYGDSKVLPIRETAQPQPRSVYGADKFGCELHGRVAFEVYGVPTVGLRFFNVYGPRQDPASPYSGVISVFCERLLKGQPIEIFGDGTQSRDFIFVNDVVAALLAAMDRVQRCSAVFNVCSGTQTTVLDLARVIGRLCGGEPDVHFRPRRLGEVVHSCGDPTFFRQELGIHDATTLSTGLSVTLSWMEAVVEARRGAKVQRASREAGFSELLK
jgi:UDP-glucose 4-epimerase